MRESPRFEGGRLVCLDQHGSSPYVRSSPKELADFASGRTCRPLWRSLATSSQRGTHIPSSLRRVYSVEVHGGLAGNNHVHGFIGALGLLCNSDRLSACQGTIR